MAVWSKIKISDIHSAKLRLDADYFKPEYIEVIKILKRCNSVPFGSKIVILTDYHANGSYETLRKHVSMVDEPDYAYMVRTTDLETDNYEKNVKYINEQAYNFLTKSKIFGGEIIINKIGSVGKVYLMPFLDKPVSLGMNQFMIRCNDINENYFIYAYLLSSYGNKIISQQVNGTVPFTITKDGIRSILIPDFEQNIKNKISYFVEQYLNKKKQSHSLYNQATQLLEKALGLDKIEFKREKCYTASFSDVINNSKMSSYFFQPKYEQLKQLLSSFKTVKLRSIISSYSTGFAFTKNHLDKEKGEAILLKIGNIKEMDIDISSTDFVNSSGTTAGVKEKVNVGDLLIGMSGSVGVTALVRENINACINQRILRIHPSVNINNEYLGIVLNSLISKLQFEKYGTGGVQVNISPKDMLNIDIPRLGEIEDEISRLSLQSYKNKLESKQLLEQAKQEVESLIEQAAHKNE